MHFFVLEGSNFTLQQSVFAPEFGKFRGSCECPLDAVVLDRVFEFLKFLGAVIEIILERSVLVLEIAFDCFDACFEGDHDAFDVLDGVEKGFAEGGQHR